MRVIRRATRPGGRQPIAWLLWHPHQKLWNWWLVGAVKRVLSSQPALADGAVRLLVLVDSLLLLSRVGLRRITSTAGTGARRDKDVVVLHIDCGPHKEGHEIVWMHKWFGQRYDLRTIAIEAGRSQFEQAAINLGGIQAVDLRRGAVVGPEHTGDTVEFHQGQADGRGASLFATRGGAVEQAPAVRLSEILASVSPQPDAIILRMNIEGAESFAIADLLASGQDACIDGYYGMWDDLSKIDPRRDRDFRKLLKRHGIRSISFNERDLGHPLRRFAIRADIETSVRRALARRQTASDTKGA